MSPTLTSLDCRVCSGCLASLSELAACFHESQQKMITASYDVIHFTKDSRVAWQMAFRGEV